MIEFWNWKLFILLMVVGISASVNFEYNSDDFLPSSKSTYVESDMGYVKNPKQIQFAKGLNQARIRLLKEARNMKRRMMMSRRNGMKPRLPAQRSMLGSQDEKFDESMEGSERYPYINSNTVGQDLIWKNSQQLVGTDPLMKKSKQSGWGVQDSSSQFESMIHYDSLNSKKAPKTEFTDIFNLEGEAESQVRPIQVRGPNDALFAEMQLSQKEAKETQDRVTRNDQGYQPLTWYTFENGNPQPIVPLPKSEGFVQTQMIQPSLELDRFQRPLLKKVNSGRKANMEHLEYENQNVHPIILDEYLQAVRGNRHVKSNLEHENSIEDTNQKRTKAGIIFGGKTKPSSMSSEMSDQVPENEAEFLEAMKVLDKIEEKLAKKHKLKNNNKDTKEIQKRKIGDNSIGNENKNDEFLERYLVTQTIRSGEKEWNDEKENQKMDQNYQYRNNGKQFPYSTAKILTNIDENESEMMRNRNFDEEWYRNDQKSDSLAKGSSKNLYQEAGVVNFPFQDSEYTVFEPTRTVHYRFAQQPIEVSKKPQPLDDESPESILNGPHTLIHLNTPPEIHRTPDTLVPLPQLFDPNGIYATQYNYKQYVPQVPVLFHLPPLAQYRWFNQPISYTYQGIRYRIPESGLTGSEWGSMNPAESEVVGMGPQFSQHARTFTPGNLFGLSRYNSGYGGLLNRVAYKKALLDKVANYENGLNYYPYVHHEYASSPLVGAAISAKDVLGLQSQYLPLSVPNQFERKSKHRLVTRDVSHDRHERVKRSPQAFHQYYQDPYQYWPPPVFQSDASALSGGYVEPRLDKRSLRNKREIQAAEKTELPKLLNEEVKKNEEEGPKRVQRNINRSGFFLPDYSHGYSTRYFDYPPIRRGRSNQFPSDMIPPNPSPEPSTYSSFDSFNNDPYTPQYKQITLKSNDDPAEIMKSLQEHNEQAVREALAKASSDSLGGQIVLNENDLNSNSQSQIINSLNHQSSSSVNIPNLQNSFQNLQNSFQNLQGEQSTNSYSYQTPPGPMPSDFLRNYQSADMLASALSSNFGPRKYSFFTSQASPNRIPNPFLQEDFSFSRPTFSPPPQIMPFRIPPTPSTASLLSSLASDPLPSASNIYARNYIHPIFTYKTALPSLGRDSFKMFDIPEHAGESFQELLNAIKSKLLACCENCKKKILKGIHQKIDDDDLMSETKTVETYTTSSYESSDPFSTSSGCKNAKNIFDEVENLSRELWKDDFDTKRKTAKSPSKKPTKAVLNEKRNKLKKLFHHLSELRKISCEDTSPDDCQDCFSEEFTSTSGSYEQNSFELTSTSKRPIQPKQKSRGSKGSRSQKGQYSNKGNVIRSSRKATSPTKRKKPDPVDVDTSKEILKKNSSVERTTKSYISSSTTVSSTTVSE